MSDPGISNPTESNIPDILEPVDTGLVAVPLPPSDLATGPIPIRRALTGPRLIVSNPVPAKEHPKMAEPIRFRRPPNRVRYPVALTMAVSGFICGAAAGGVIVMALLTPYLHP